MCGLGGRMGAALLQLARERADVKVVGGIARDVGAVDGIPTVPVSDSGTLIEQCDVVVDFSSAAGTAALLEHASGALAGRALVVGTTGLARDTRAAIDTLGGRAAVLTAANFSVGVNLLLALTERVAGTLSAGEFDIEIVEAHHRRKTDAPSGTALALAEAAARGRNVALDDVRRDGRSGDSGERPRGEVGIHAVRGGSVVGEHTVMFIGERERIELRHEATDRALFAEGALRAAVWMRGRSPGHYDMKDVLGLGS